MTGSKSIEDRKFLLKFCHKIIFNSNWSKKRFLQGMHDKFVNSEKLLVVFQSAKKNKINIKNKKNWITFVGKLNKSKGYDIFGSAIIKILNNNKQWKGLVIGDEQRDKIVFNHKNLKKYGFINHNKVIDIYKKTSIAVVCSRWEEPFGRKLNTSGLVVKKLASTNFDLCNILFLFFLKSGPFLFKGSKNHCDIFKFG